MPPKRAAKGADVQRGRKRRGSECEELVLDGEEEADGGGAAQALDPARQRALELLRLAGGVAAPDPNATRRALPGVAEEVRRIKAAAQNAGGGGDGRPAAPAAVASRPPLVETTGSSQAHAAAPPPPPGAKPAPASAMEAAFGAVLQQSGAGGGASGSRYRALVDEEEEARLDRVVGALERRDELAQRMDSVTRLAVQAFCCRACGYTAERRRPECAAHAHAVARVEARGGGRGGRGGGRARRRNRVQRSGSHSRPTPRPLRQVTKRWWRCDGCSYRFSTVAQKYPRACRK